MALGYKTRRRLSLLVLLVGLPAYIVVGGHAGWADSTARRSWFELAVYLGLGFVWILPLRAVFRGVGQPDPDQDDPQG